MITLGQRADLVLLDADALADIANVSKIRGVMVQGRWLPKAELQRMLEALPVAYSAGIGALKQVYSHLEEVDRTSIALEEATFQLLDLNRDSDAIQLFFVERAEAPRLCPGVRQSGPGLCEERKRRKAVKYFTEALRIDASFEHASAWGTESVRKS